MGSSLRELLFFDTFSHEFSEDINLDLVQFPKPVYITEVRIIPLGAKVQADFPGGVRLGATNPSKFGIEFFVNDLGKPGASTFENLGQLNYNQNDCINLECENDKIPTDGLVLRGWYTTITLAVYGTLTKHLTEQIASPPPPVDASPEEVSLVPVQITTGDPIVKEQKIDWPDEVPNPAVDVAIFEPEVYVEPIVFDGAVFEQTATPAIATAAPQYADDCFLSAIESSRDVEKRPIARRKSRSSERSSSRNRTYSHSDSNDREYNSRSKREWSRSPEYRHARRIRRDRSREDRDHVERDHKRPRTPPPAQQLPPGSPRRPRSPAPEHLTEQFADVGEDSDYKYRQKCAKASGQPIRVIGSDQAPKSPATVVEPADESLPQQPIDDETMSQDEQFEPILSDEEIGDDNEEPENEDLEMEDNDVEDAIKHFDPFKMRLQRYEMDLSSSCFRDSEILVKVLRKYEIQTQTNSREDFLNSSADEKENFVILSEQLMSHLQQISMSSLHRRNYILEKTFEEQSEHLKLAISVLKVALDFECACSQPQPGYKVRHIKIGARLAELFCISTEFLDYFITTEGCDPFKSLFDLYEKEYMALSIKLLLLKAIYSILDTKLGVNIFLNNKLNGYQRLLTILNGNPLTRAKFSIKSIIKKVNLFECLEKIRDLVTKQFVLTNHLVDNPFSELEMCLSQTLNAMTKESLSYQQPKRFLPVSEKFELVRDVTAQRSWGHMLHSYFSSHALGESLLLIVSNQMVVPSSILNLTFGLIASLVRSQFALDYLIYDCFETTELLVKCLLGVEEEQDAAEMEKTGNEDECQVKEKKSKDFPRPLSRGQQLGIEIAFRIQSRFHVDAIKNTKDNVDSLLDHLHALYSQNCSYIGRLYTIESIGLNNNLIPFLNLIEKERKAQTQRQQGSPGIKFKSPVLSYAVDLIDSCVRHCTNLEYLIEHGSVLMELVKSHEIFEPAVSAMLQEMAVYLKPLEVVNNFTYDDITQLCEVIKRSIEFITTFPGDLIMGLRILRYLGISSDFGEIRELKYRYVILQFYSADGVVTLVSILEKLNTYFEQPGLHSATLMTMQAVHACQILLPTLEVLREMLTFVIQCRDTQFKDLTAIEHLMKTYCLMHHYPEMSQAFDEAQKVKSEIIKILLAYTQPNPEDEESVHKSLWTQMIREVVKSILSAPSTFIPGLQVLAELLPLPLPVQTLQPLSGTETHRLMTERKLWSAHLHPESANLTELIQTICPSTFPQLKDLLTRVCLQLADLAPNMTLLVSKSVIDMILNDSSTTLTAPGSAGLARLLQFLGQLTAYASVKISSLSIFSGRLYEFFNQILSNNDTSEPHQQCQKNVHRIYENFFDSEISMIAPNSTGSAELNLACALPSKELISGIAGAVAANLMNSPIGGPVSIAASRNLIILTEHDITFYYLKVALEAKKDLFQDWLQKLAELQEKEPHSGLFGTIVIFFRALLFIDDSSPDSTLPIRTMKLSASQLAAIVGWTNNPEKPHMLQRMAKVLSDEAEPRNEELLQDFSNLIACLQSAADTVETEEKFEFTEPLLPQAEGIVTQYLSRPIFTLFEASDEAQLGASYWLDPIRLDSSSSSDEINLQNERVAKDLAEMVETCLPPDTNLSSDCKRILHLSASPQSNRERTTTAPCFRTRRVEVEPSTGRPEKKIFVTPMRGRGFPRTPPSRGDLFRSRPPNTSRPPSLHVDDFLALETCGAQPTGPTGYNKLSRDIINIRGTRGGRGRGNRMSSGGSYRTNSPNTWSHVDSSGGPPPQHFRTATSEPVNDSHYGQPHFGGAPIRSRGRGRLRTFLR